MPTYDKKKLVVVSAGLSQNSKTDRVFNIYQELNKRYSLEITNIKFSEIGDQIGTALYRDKLNHQVKKALNSIENADILIVGTPVYRASFSGLFKHFFDFVDQYALEGKPEFLAASGGSERHSLVLEYYLRPLISFFKTYTLPMRVYATDHDFL